MDQKPVRMLKESRSRDNRSLIDKKSGQTLCPQPQSLLFRGAGESSITFPQGVPLLSKILRQTTWRNNSPNIPQISAIHLQALHHAFSLGAIQGPLENEFNSQWLRGKRLTFFLKNIPITYFHV